jgi:hypothetical protein
MGIGKLAILRYRDQCQNQEMPGVKTLMELDFQGSTRKPCRGGGCG